jgi:hypothetical protein
MLSLFQPVPLIPHPPHLTHLTHPFSNRAKPHTAMQHHPEPSLDELLWTIAAARIILGPSMNIQAPPNLTPAQGPDSSSSSSSEGSSWRVLLDAGINDWGKYRVPARGGGGGQRWCGGLTGR